MDFATLRGMLEGFAAIEGTSRLSGTEEGWCLNMAMRRLARLHEWSYNAADDFADTAPGVETLAFPARMAKLHRLYYLDATGKEVDLQYVRSREEFRGTFPRGTTPDTPTHFSLWGRKTYFGPPPAGIVRIYREFWQLPADLVDDIDTNDLIDNAYEAVLFVALADFVPLILIEDARIPAWKAQRDDLVGDLESEQSRLVSVPGNLLEMEVPG